MKGFILGVLVGILLTAVPLGARPGDEFRSDVDRRSDQDRLEPRQGEQERRIDSLERIRKEPC
jgi:hypothetical protein